MVRVWFSDGVVPEDVIKDLSALEGNVFLKCEWDLFIGFVLSEAKVGARWDDFRVRLLLVVVIWGCCVRSCFVLCGGLFLSSVCVIVLVCVF